VQRAPQARLGGASTSDVERSFSCVASVLSKKRGSLCDTTCSVDLQLHALRGVSESDKASLIAGGRAVWRQAFGKQRRSQGRKRRWVSGRPAKRRRVLSEKSWTQHRRQKLAQALSSAGVATNRATAAVLASSLKHAAGAWTEKHQKAAEKLARKPTQTCGKKRAAAEHQAATRWEAIKRARSVAAWALV
jgi:hypothetical protein